MKFYAHFDFHTMPGIRNLGKKIDIPKTIKALKDANISYINMFARCNVGFSYYPTKVGFKYPGLDFDFLGEVIAECKKQNMEIIAYLNGGVNHEFCRVNPGCMQIRKNGEVYINPQGESNHIFRAPCIHSEYRDHLLAEIKEIIAKKPDGIFCDCLFVPRCYCPRCIAKMNELGVNIDNDDEVYAFGFEAMRQLARDIKAIVPKGMKAYFNSFNYPDVADIATHNELECLPSNPIWGYDFFTANALHNRLLSDTNIYMTGRFTTSWGDFGGFKSMASIENDFYDALLYGYSPSVGDHMHPVYGIDEKLYKDVGKAFKEIDKLSPYLDNAKPMVDMAVLKTKLSHENHYRFADDLGDKGVARMFSDLKMNFDIINEDMDFDKYKLIVLPDNLYISKKLEEKLNAYKGAILSCGKSYCDSERWSFIKDVEADKNKHGFYSWEGRNLSMYSTSVKFKSDYSISDYVEPYFDAIWDGEHAYKYIPDDECRGFSAVAIKDNTAHICFNIYKAYLENAVDYFRDLVGTLLTKLLPQPLVTSNDLPPSSRVTLMNGEKGDVLQIKSTYAELWNARGSVSKHAELVRGKKVSVLGEYTSAVTLPELTPLNISTEAGRTEIELPDIIGYKAFLLK